MTIGSSNTQFPYIKWISQVEHFDHTLCMFSVGASNFAPRTTFDHSSFIYANWKFFLNFFGFCIKFLNCK